MNINESRLLNVMNIGVISLISLGFMEALAPLII